MLPENVECLSAAVRFVYAGEDRDLGERRKEIASKLCNERVVVAKEPESGIQESRPRDD